MAAPPDPSVRLANSSKTSATVVSSRASRASVDLLGVAAALAVDDQGVGDLPAVDHRGGQVHRVDEPEARVGEVEVEARRRQAELPVHVDRRRGFEVGAAHRGVDQQPDALPVDAGGRDRLAPGHGGRVRERDVLRPPAPLDDAGDLLQQPGRRPSRSRVPASRSSNCDEGTTIGASAASTDSTEVFVCRKVVLPRIRDLGSAGRERPGRREGAGSTRRRGSGWQ
jgi:hypothetical protein